MSIITIHPDGTDIVCECGNDTRSDGFFPCDSEGNEMEPTLDSDWDGLYLCPPCGQLHRFEEAK